MVRPYHTSLKSHEVHIVSNQIGRGCGCETCTVFVHDMEHGLPTEFNHCDVIFSEPPWPAGYGEFSARAGKTSHSFSRFAGALSAVCVGATRDVPVVLVVGKLLLRRLPCPTRVTDGWIDSGGRILARCLIACWGRNVLNGESRTSTLLSGLAQEFWCVGDPCCGYGNTGRIFMANGRHAVMSDVNQACVDYVAGNVESWHGEQNEQ